MKRRKEKDDCEKFVGSLVEIKKNKKRGKIVAGGNGCLIVDVGEKQLVSCFLGDVKIIRVYA